MVKITEIQKERLLLYGNRIGIIDDEYSGDTTSFLSDMEETISKISAKQMIPIEEYMIVSGFTYLEDLKVFSDPKPSTRASGFRAMIFDDAGAVRGTTPNQWLLRRYNRMSVINMITERISVFEELYRNHIILGDIGTEFISRSRDLDTKIVERWDSVRSMVAKNISLKDKYQKSVSMRAGGYTDCESLFIKIRSAAIRKGVHPEALDKIIKTADVYTFWSDKDTFHNMDIYVGDPEFLSRPSTIQTMMDIWDEVYDGYLEYGADDQLIGHEELAVIAESDNAIITYDAGSGAGRIAIETIAIRPMSLGEISAKTYPVSEDITKELVKERDLILHWFLRRDGVRNG